LKPIWKSHLEIGSKVRELTQIRQKIWSKGPDNRIWGIYFGS